MSSLPEPLETNRVAWDERAPAHAASPGYRVAEFAADPAFISDVVRFDLPRLGDLRGRRGVHLQCHIGTDTVSLSRLGARMTGLDFSGASLAEARRLAALAGADVDFVESDVYEAAHVLPDAGRFDLVYTGIGALCWLPDIERWAGVVADLLAPGGRLFVRDGHPVLRALADDADQPVLHYSYFAHPDDPVVDESPGTYVETEVEFTHLRNYSWNHGLGEIVTALLGHGLVLTGLVEHDSVPWEALPGQMVQGELGEWRLRDRPSRLPASFTLQAVKPPAA